MRFYAFILLPLTGSRRPPCGHLTCVGALKRSLTVAPAASGASPALHALGADIQCDSAALIIYLRNFYTLFAAFRRNLNFGFLDLERGICFTHFRSCLLFC